MNSNREIPTEQEARLLVRVETLQRQLEMLAEENGALRYQRDIARADLKMFVPRATPEEEAEAIRLKEISIPNGLSHLIASLEVDGVAGGRQRS